MDETFVSSTVEEDQSLMNSSLDAEIVEEFALLLEAQNLWTQT